MKNNLEHKIVVKKWCDSRINPIFKRQVTSHNLPHKIIVKNGLILYLVLFLRQKTETWKGSGWMT